MSYSIEQIKLQIKIYLLQLRVLILRQKLTIPNLPGPKHIVVHHGGGFLDFDGVNRYHEMKWGFKSSLGFYAGYHYFIERDGTLIQARADNEEAAHCVEKGNPGYWNKNALSVCLMGDGDERDFTPGQYKTLESFTNRKRIQYGLPYSETKGHEEIKPTDCPSKVLMDWIINYRNPIIA